MHSINSDGSYDILYFEKIEDKDCVEKCVRPDRIFLAKEEDCVIANEDEAILNSKLNDLKSLKVFDLLFSMIVYIKIINTQTISKIIDDENYDLDYKNSAHISKILSTSKGR